MKGSTTKKKLNNGHRLAIAAFWLSMWQLAYLLIGRDIFVPSPFMVGQALGELVWEPLFWQSVGFSILRVFIGIVLSTTAGLVLGVLAGLKAPVYHVLNPLVTAIKATPVMSFIIVALVWFKSDNVPVFICFLMCFPIIWTNVVAGLQEVDDKLLEMASIYGVQERHILRWIYLPSMLPYFKAGLTMALGLGWKVSVAAEVLSHPQYAIGSQLHSAKVYLDTPALFAYTAVVIALSFAFEKVFRWGIQRRPVNER